MYKQNKISKAYDSVYSSNVDSIQKLNLKRWPKNRWEALIHSIPPCVENVLEIGCGNGVVLHHIADRCQSMTGIEISHKRCEVARKNLAGIKTPVEIFQANIEEGINKPDATYDVILWADVIEHVVDIFASMREIVRLLTPGGTLITNTPNLAYIQYRIALMLGKFPGTAAKDQGFAVRCGEMYDGGHLHYFTTDVMKRLYTMHGLKVTAVEGFGKLGRLHNLRPSLLSGSIHIVGKKVGFNGTNSH